MDWSPGFLFGSIDLYFCLCASTILSWWLWLCSRAWSQAGWFLQFHSSFSRLLWLFELFCISIQIVKLFVLVMAPHSSTLAWRIPWTEEPGGLQSMGSLRVLHDWATSLWLFTFMHWRRKWQPTLVFLPGESQGRRSLVGCRLWGRTESDTTEVT